MYDRAARSIKETAPEKLTFCMRVTNIINAGLLIASGVITFTLLNSCDDNCSILIVLAFYTILFGLLLLIFELRSGPKSAKWIHGNCGFMYSNRGKAAFILFLATLCFSVTDKDLSGLWWFCLLVGIYTTLNGIFACFVVALNPAYDEYTKANLPENVSRVEASSPSFDPTAPGATIGGGAPASGYRYGDAHIDQSGDFGGYNSYDLHEPQPSYGQNQAAYGQTSTPFADHSYNRRESDDNPFSHV